MKGFLVGDVRFDEFIVYLENLIWTDYIQKVT